MTRTWHTVRALAVGAALGLVARSALASPCVALPAGDRLDARVRDKAVEQLSVSLSQHGIGICRDGQDALAEVELRPAGRDVAILIRDAVTRKEVSRTVRLGSVPQDGRALAIAVASDELLRATWAEILLSRAPSPPPEPPPEVRAVVVASLPADLPKGDGAPEARPASVVGRPLFLSVNVAGEHATGGLTLGGVDARFGGWVLSRVNVSARVGARAAPSASSTDGSATANALLAGVGASMALLPRAAVVVLEVPLRLDVYRVQFLAHPSPGAVGTDATGLGVTLSSGLVLGVPLGRGWRFDAEATAGAVLHAVDANDASKAFTSLSGAWLGAAVGVRAEM